MNELQIFNNPEFGQLRTFIEPDGTKLICGSDVAKALGYSRPKDAIKTHCPHAVKRRLGVQTGTKIDGSPSIQMLHMSFIPEGDVYRLMYKAADQSNNPAIKEKAERFGGWIFDDVLPKINREGAYITARADPAALRRKADELESMATLNDTAKILLPIFEQAGMKPAFCALAMRQIYRKAGIDLPVNDLKADRELYDLRAIAKRVGLYSLNEKPHELAVGAIIRMIDVPSEEKELVNFEKNGHMGTTHQYTAAVADMVRQWLVDHDCPESIVGTKSGKAITYKVKYQAEMIGGDAQ